MQLTSLLNAETNESETRHVISAWDFKTGKKKCKYMEYL